MLQAGGDDDLCPLSEIHVPPAGLASDLAPVWTEEQALRLRHRAPPDGPPALIAAGCERWEPRTGEVAGTPSHGLERRVVIRSCPLAPAAERGRRGRLAKAQAERTALKTRGRGRRRDADPRALRQAVEAILARSRGHGLLHVRDQARCWERPRRRYGGRDPTVRLEWDVQVTVRPTQETVTAAVRQLGGRVSVTTHPPEPLSVQEAVLAYRNAYVVERALGRLQGRPLALTPRSLERDDHATGVIRLLSSGWRILTRLEFGVRQRWATAKTTWAGLYVGNPKRATAHPPAERLLEALQGLTLTSIRDGRRRRRHRTPLAHVHQRILALLAFSADMYTRLCADSHKPP